MSPASRVVHRLGTFSSPELDNTLEILLMMKRYREIKFGDDLSAPVADSPRDETEYPVFKIYTYIL